MSDLNYVNVENETVNIEVFSQTDKALEMLKEKYGDVPVSLETKIDYDANQKNLSAVIKYRTDLEKSRKMKKEPFMKAGKIIDKEAKRITAILKTIEEPMALIKVEYNEREAKKKEERIARLQSKIDDIKLLADTVISGDSQQISEIMEKISAIDCNEYYDLSKQAFEVKEESLKNLTGQYTQRVEFERSEKLRKEQEAINREAEAEAKLDLKINRFAMLIPTFVGQPSGFIRDAIDSYESVVIDVSYGDRQEEAKNELSIMLQKMHTMYQEALDLEEFKAMKDAKKKEAEEKLLAEQKEADDAKRKELPVEELTPKPVQSNSEESPNLYTVTLTTIAIVQADNESEAYNVARDNLSEITSEIDTDITVGWKFTNEIAFPASWDEDCIPYGGDGNTRIKDLI